MLSQVKGEDIEATWEDAWPAILEALPDEEKMIPNLKDNVLQAVKDDTMQLWVIKTGEGTVKAVMSTYISINNNVGIRELFIYSLYTFETLTPDEFNQGLLVLFEYASLCGCYSVGAYTNVQALQDFAKQAGGFVTTKVTIPVVRRT